MKAALSVTFTVTLLVAGCSGSSEPEAIGTSETPATVTPSSPTPSTSTPSSPTRIPKGTVRVTPLRSLPPEEKLPAFRATKIVAANYPAGLAAAPNERIFYSELWEGKIRVIRPNGSLDPEPWADVNAIYGIRWKRFFHGGLSGIAFDRAFARNHFVYVVTQVPHKGTGYPVRSLILRFREVKGRGSSPRILLTIPAKIWDNTYSLVFGPDQMLYIPSGFLGRSRPKGKDPLADRRGKINLVMPGHNYGYPEHEGFTRIRGLTPPMLDYESDRTAPVGIIYYSGSRYPALRGRFLMCENNGRGMLALRINRSNPGRLLSLTPIVGECTIDLVQMPDGTVVFSDAQAIFRLVPN